MLDYGYRSMCCKAPIRLKFLKKNNVPRQVWACTKCNKTNINIVSLSDLNNEIDVVPQKFSDD